MKRISLYQEYQNAIATKAGVNVALRESIMDKIDTYNAVKRYMPSSMFSRFREKATLAEAKQYLKVYKRQGLSSAYTYLTNII